MNLRKIGFWAALGAIVLAQPAWCLDPDALAQKQYPADGTFDQSDLCAASMSLMYLAMSHADLSNNPNGAQFRDNLPMIISVFSREAARLKGVTVADYQASLLPQSIKVVGVASQRDPKMPVATIKYCFAAFKAITSSPTGDRASGRAAANGTAASASSGAPGAN